MGKLFGTDGVRGVANTELTPELAFRLGRAGASLFTEQDKQPTLVIGRDTRISGEMLEAALIAGICSAGGNVITVGVVPTPAVAYLTRTLEADAGIVISASHNPAADNGIKFFCGDGYKLPDAIEERLERLVLSVNDEIPRPTGSGVGTVMRKPEALDMYIDYVTTTTQQDFRKLKIVIDCAHGAAYEVAPRAFRRLGANVIVLNAKPNGTNINVECGSTHPEALRRAVVEHGAHVGIAHDGDADRLIAVDEKGNIVDGDFILAICGMHMMKKGILKDDTLVATVMSNLGLHLAFKNAGGKIITTQVGDRYVLEAMREHKLSLGGEQSGHIIFLDHNTTGDGIITAIQLVSAVKETGKSLSELAGVMTRLPQVLVNVRVKDKTGWDQNPAIKAVITDVETQLGDNGRVLVRPSGTEPLIRVMAEGPDEKELKSLVEKIIDVVTEELSK
jgi:phosphoglucosamine mutase